MVTHHPEYLDHQGSCDRFLDNIQHILHLPDGRAAREEDKGPGVLAVSGEKGSILIKVVFQKKLTFCITNAHHQSRTRGFVEVTLENIAIGEESGARISARLRQVTQCGLIRHSELGRLEN